jgi:hypothetical protein
MQMVTPTLKLTQTQNDLTGIEITGPSCPPIGLVVDVSLVPQGTGKMQ